MKKEPIRIFQPKKRISEADRQSMAAMNAVFINISRINKRVQELEAEQRKANEKATSNTKDYVI